jgi:transposase-like protein
MSKNANYTSEFKREAVKLSQSAGKPSSQVAMELGVKPNTLYNWISNSMKEQKPIAKAKLSPSHRYKELEQENRRLQKELRRARMERDILKKAAAYFASHEL